MRRFGGGVDRRGNLVAGCIAHIRVWFGSAAFASALPAVLDSLELRQL